LSCTHENVIITVTFNGPCRQNVQNPIAMHSEALPKLFRPRATQTILVGGAIAGLLDGLDAVIFYWLAFAVSPAAIFQGIASGLLGQRSFQGGWLTLVLGIALQFFIAIGAAAFYYAATLLIPILLRKPWISGPAFGIGLFFFMQRVVLPLSAVHKRTAPMSLGELVDQLLSHAFLVGLPIALMARRSARLP
jgi:hypothetical protein